MTTPMALLPCGTVEPISMIPNAIPRMITAIIHSKTLAIEAYVPPADLQYVLDAGLQGIIRIEAAVYTKGRVIFIRGVTVEEYGGDVGCIIGEPEQFAVRAVVVEPNQLEGIPVTDDAHQPTRKCECVGECQTVEIDSNGYDGESMVGGMVPGECIARKFPPPDFDTPGVKDASRGKGRELETDVTPRVKRYALYYW